MENYYHKTIEKWMTESKCGETAARKMNEIIDHKIMEMVRKSNKELYWEVMRDLHEVCEGCHYNEIFAQWEVTQMTHTDADGVIHRGEHWSMEKIKDVFTKVELKLSPDDTVYDLYVALHSFWHDNINLYTLWFADDADSKIADAAINYFFMDSDAPDGKIWKYYRGMNR